MEEIELFALLPVSNLVAVQRIRVRSLWPWLNIKQPCCVSWFQQSLPSASPLHCASTANACLHSEIHQLKDSFAKNKREKDERIGYISGGPVPVAAHSATLREAELAQP